MSLESDVPIRHQTYAKFHTWRPVQRLEQQRHRLHGLVQVRNNHCHCVSMGVDEWLLLMIFRGYEVYSLKHLCRHDGTIRQQTAYLGKQHIHSGRAKVSCPWKIMHTQRTLNARAFFHQNSIWFQRHIHHSCQVKRLPHQHYCTYCTCHFCNIDKLKTRKLS